MTLSYVLFIIGVFFFALSSLGLMRMPDAYCRLHAASLGDTFGFGFIILGLIFLVSGFSTIIKLLLVWAVIWIINPATSHYVSKVALLRGNWVVLTQRRRSSKKDEEEVVGP